MDGECTATAPNHETCHAQLDRCTHGSVRDYQGMLPGSQVKLPDQDSTARVDLRIVIEVDHRPSALCYQNGPQTFAHANQTHLVRRE